MAFPLRAIEDCFGLVNLFEELISGCCFPHISLQIEQFIQIVDLNGAAVK